ncbi:uncharacterized protein [Aegilops tauschii subsp. strangulata]|uniref:Uncharacterized protein n=1 Tax=Aegilops tauschii subsp. strangulata TaxID=200361 RepID=A0A453HQK4_AEGTS|nr:uncharacterized protein LOC109773619 [Aegilops tauschii subsp. strangulata]
MAFDTNNLVLHIRRLVRSSIRLGYHSACGHPEVLGAGIALLFLHALCPSLFAFVLSSSPVIVLTAILLGALLSYGEAAVPLDGEETLEEHEPLSLKSNIHFSDCSDKEVENIAVEVQLEKRTETDSCEVVHVRERASDDCMHDALCEDKNVTYIASDAAVLSEAYAEEEATPYDSLHDTHCEEKRVTFVADDTVPSAEPCNHPEINATLECEERAKETSEKAELQEPESTCTGSCNNGVHYQYQFGEFMRSCWQPVMRQDLPYCDSESDLTDESSSPDASMTDIIPMLEDLHPLINSGTGQLSLASRENLNSSSDENEFDLEEEEQDDSVSSDDDEGAERQQDNEVNWKDVVQLNCLDMEQNDKLGNLVELQRAKNMLKFELDMRSIDLQAADATRKLKDASRFRVQVPSICTPRHNPFNPSRDSEESIELPQIPGSAPSVLLRRRNLFDLPFDRAVHQRSRFQESWTPRSRFRSAQAQNMKHRNSRGQNHSTYNGEMGDNHSDDDAEQEGSNVNLFGSLEAHLGEEMKILSAAISDVGVLGDVNHETDEGNGDANVRDDAASLPGAHDSEPHSVEADSMSEMNSLFRCRMEEVLVQSVSEGSVCQPLGVKPEAIPSAPSSSDSWMHASKASSIEELKFQLLTADEEALTTCAASGLNGHSESIRDQSSEALCVVYKQSSELSTAGEQQTAGMSEPNETLTTYCDELPVVEVANVSVEEMNSLFEQLEEETQPSNGRSKMDIPQDGLCQVEVDLVELSLDRGLSAP